MLKLSAEDMLKKLRTDGAEMPTMSCDPKVMGVLKSHHCEDSSLITNNLINLIAQVDDGACVFNNRDAMLKFFEIVHKAMSKRGLTSRVGKNEINPKQKLIFFHVLQP